MANAESALAASAHFTRGGHPAAPDHDASVQARRTRLKTEQCLLIKWSKENQKLKTTNKRLPQYSRGGEHQVFFHKSASRYIKATLPERHLGYGIALGSYIHGATPSEYLDRLCLHNQIFNDDIRLEYVIENQGTPIIVTSQTSIKGVPPSQTSIDDMMIERRFEKIADGAFYDQPNGILIFDLFPRNAIQTEEGDVLPIDPVIQRISPDFAQFLRENPNTINSRP